ncbi:alpha/beta hydrolase [Kibdelosporangium aridum]|uniref:alpha/beta hydrolase n=1 Tax=Kibdelosporangium aridum TaxID=2030 RepID=UPI0035E8781E
MRPITRALGLALACVGVVLGGGVTSIQTAGAKPLPTRTISWNPCPEDATAECGTLQLPIDYTNPAEEQFDLAVVRRKATDSAERLGSLLVNPGGPGGSGVDFVLRAKDYFSEDIESRFDIVSWDPRGVARSKPVMCSRELRENGPTTYPGNDAEYNALAQYNQQLLADCRARSGSIVDHADTSATVRDMDAIRVALGEKKISYYGVAYGTLIGQQYAEQYGDKIRTMVLDSNINHDQTSWPFIASQAHAEEAAFKAWEAWCERTVSCALHGNDVDKLWRSVLQRADRGELTDPDDPGRTVTARYIVNVAFGAFQGPDWPFLAEYVAKLDAQKPAQRRDPATARQVKDDEVNDVFQATFCDDWSLPVNGYPDHEDMTGLENIIAVNMRGGLLGHDWITSCIGLPTEVNNPQHRLNITNAPKILMLNSLYDPITPHTWALAVQQQTRETTVLLTYEGGGHGVYGRSECTTAPVDEYLTTLKLPETDRCAAVDPAAPATPGRGAGTMSKIAGWSR